MLTGSSSPSLARLQSLAADYRAYFFNTPGATPTQPEIAHNGRFYLIDPNGRIRRSYGAAHRGSRLILAELQQLNQTKSSMNCEKP